MAVTKTKSQYVAPEIQDVLMEGENMLLSASPVESSQSGVQSGSAIFNVYHENTESLSKQNDSGGFWDYDE